MNVTDYVNLHKRPTRRKSTNPQFLIFVTFAFVLFLPDFTFAQSYLTDADFRAAADLGSDEISLSTDDFVAADRLTITDLYRPQRDAVKLSKQRGGDLRVRRHEADFDPSVSGGTIRRNGVRSFGRMWPSARIPYTISSHYTGRERAIIARAMSEYHKRTCVRFEPRQPNDSDYVFIGKIDGCFSDVGRAHGRQELSLGHGCLEYDTVIHELMHAVGFYHEHERWDRDAFIDIQWQNIDRDAYDQFGRVNLTESSYYNQPYDYFSILHYERDSFSKNGQDTIRTKDPRFNHLIGMARDFSKVDLAKINQMYNCQAGAGGTFTAPQQPQVITPTPWVITGRPVFQTTTRRPVPAAAPCRDEATLCWKWLDRCTSLFFERIMREFCSKSCGFCRP